MSQELVTFDISIEDHQALLAYLPLIPSHAPS
jgi:hypothetical protein